MSTPPRASSTDRSRPVVAPPSSNGHPARSPGGAAPAARGAPSRSGPASTRTDAPPPSTGGKPPDLILFQSFFKSVGPRTYAAQVKEAKNGNHYLVLTEGKREKDSDEVRKTRLYVFSEDFPAFFRLLHETAQHIRANPVPDEVRRKRAKFWTNKQRSKGGSSFRQRSRAPGS